MSRLIRIVPVNYILAEFTLTRNATVQYSTIKGA